jgi:5-methylcytosine-specific restriction endonuclease McrA
MLIAIVELPRSGKSVTRTKKVLYLKCDECSKDFHHHWQREVAERIRHFCSRTCVNMFKSKDETWKLNISSAVKKRLSEPETRERLEKGIERRNADPTFRQKISAAAKLSFESNPTRAKNISDLMKNKLSDPDYYAKFVERQNDPKLREQRSQAAKKRWCDINNRHSMSEKIKASWESCQTGHGSSEWIAKQSQAQRSVWNDENYRLSRSGENNPMSGKINPWWQPWMSDNQSSIKWANAIRKLSGNQCLICSNTDNLEAHHVAPQSTHPELILDLRNGVALCSRCHVGADNENNVHRILKNDPIVYESIMKDLMLKRDRLLYLE